MRIRGTLTFPSRETASKSKKWVPSLVHLGYGKHEYTVFLLRVLAACKASWIRVIGGWPWLGGGSGQWCFWKGVESEWLLEIRLHLTRIWYLSPNSWHLGISDAKRGFPCWLIARARCASVAVLTVANNLWSHRRLGVAVCRRTDCLVVPGGNCRAD